MRPRIASYTSRSCARGELLTQERVRNTRVLHLVLLQAVERVLNDFVVVEGELGQLIDRGNQRMFSLHAVFATLGGGESDAQYTNGKPRARDQYRVPVRARPTTRAARALGCAERHRMRRAAPG